MAYVILDGPVRTADYVMAFQPVTERAGETIIRYLDLLVSTSKNRALVETVVVESGRSVRFFIEVRDRDDGVNVRPDPLTDPEKTPGVKRSVAQIAEKIHSLSSNQKYGNTNIREFLSPS